MCEIFGFFNNGYKAGALINRLLSNTKKDICNRSAAFAVRYAVESGLIKGKSNSTLEPQDNATRAEIAAVLQRFIEANN